MSSLLRIEDDSDGWDLNAVVRSCRPTSSSPSAPPPPPPPHPWETFVFHSTEAFLRSHDSDLIDTTNFVSNSIQELEELCKPFISTTHHPKFHLSPISSSPASIAPRSQLPRSKKSRKNQPKRMVSQVVADGVSGDMWAWRKYGQKPIKGSPFPRGYYRCSSSKGCVARKQVERSRTDQGMFVITYTGDHNHPPPTHRNSLAGSTRQKFPTAGEEGVRLSPKTPLKKKKKREGSTDDDEEEDEEELDMLSVEDLEVVGDDGVMFMGFEELQNSVLDVEDGLFVWDDETRRTGWLPAVAD